ncbi:Adenylate cyclase [Caenispirillum salinarum AK4]|uniref:Adenylate cyclase n=1 Tax=Caenispirillum salinarum AK4 TaxID=1238182 RepID=K9H6Z2_9PROT|nr:GAF domain-containing protein [Caenispirillum salinarum]EKV26383.1 Adenylate cyclase [Caenispirillum salinarum AK4]
MTAPPLTLDAIRTCLEGVVPASIATCDGDGVPNVSLLSQVHHVDDRHVALTYQFFNKTRRNILANPYAVLQVMDPLTVAEYRLRVRYLRTETAGPLFETMKARLAGIASHSGMAGVFRLLGADIYRVLEIEAVPGAPLPPQPPRSLLPDVRRTCQRLAEAAGLDDILEETLAALQARFGIDHAMILVLDETGERLFTVASRGYPRSGVGSEVAVGDGVIGVAARERTPIRITHFTTEYAYSIAAGAGSPPADEIPFPGLAEPHSQLAVPIAAGGRLFGVLFVESARELAFCYEHEDALATISAQMAALMLARAPGAPAADPAGATPAPAAGPAAVVRHYPADNSVFIDHDYLIKGVAGAIFWKMIRDYLRDGRQEFSNRELRLSPEIRLPGQAENLEARLILLRRRLAERCDGVRIEPAGRGRARLVVTRPLALDQKAPA